MLLLKTKKRQIRIRLKLKVGSLNIAESLIFELKDRKRLMRIFNLDVTSAIWGALFVGTQIVQGSLL